MADELNLTEKSRIMDSARMKRALSRLASEIVEENQGADDLYIVGIRRRGVPLAERIVDKIEAIEGHRPQFGIHHAAQLRLWRQPDHRFAATVRPVAQYRGNRAKRFCGSSARTRS